MSRRASELHAVAETNWRRELTDAHSVLATERRKVTSLEQVIDRLQREAAAKDATIHQLKAQLLQLEDERRAEQRRTEEAKVNSARTREPCLPNAAARHSRLSHYSTTASTYLACTLRRFHRSGAGGVVPPQCPGRG